MSKRQRNRDNNTNLTSSSPPMRRGENSARAIKALRSDETAKFRRNLVQVYNEAVQHETPRQRTGRSRPDKGRGDTQTQPRRNLPSVAEMSSPGLPSQVRHELLDGVRLFSCVSRHARKETLFALRRIGKGKSGRGIRKAKWTDKSYLRCK